jgi:hypothetical protein
LAHWEAQSGIERTGMVVDYQERIEFAAILARTMEPGDDDEALKTACKLWKLSDAQLCRVGEYLRLQWLASVLRPMKSHDTRPLLSKPCPFR